MRRRRKRHRQNRGGGATRQLPSLAAAERVEKRENVRGASHASGCLLPSNSSPLVLSCHLFHGCCGSKGHPFDSIVQTFTLPQVFIVFKCTLGSSSSSPPVSNVPQNTQRCYQSVTLAFLPGSSTGWASPPSPSCCTSSSSCCTTPGAPASPSSASAPLAG